MSLRQFCIIIGLIMLVSGHPFGLALLVFAYFFMSRDDDD